MCICCLQGKQPGLSCMPLPGCMDLQNFGVLVHDCLLGVRAGARHSCFHLYRVLISSDAAAEGMLPPGADGAITGHAPAACQWRGPSQRTCGAEGMPESAGIGARRPQWHILRRRRRWATSRSPLGAAGESRALHLGTCSADVRCRCPHAAWPWAFLCSFTRLQGRPFCCCIWQL